MIKFIKDYFGLEIPIWMRSRKNLFIFFFLDFMLFIFIKTYQYELDYSSKYIFISIILSFLWCLISYINGKYSYFINQEYLFLKFFKLIKSNLISLTVIYLLEKLIIIYFPTITPLGRNRIFLLGFISFSLQFLKLYIYNIRVEKKEFYIIGDKYEIESFKDLVKEFPIIKNIKIINYSNQIPYNSEKRSLLILNEEIENQYNFRNLKELNIEKFTPFKWCERYLNRIPIKYLSNKEYQKYNWDINSDNFQWRLKRFGDITISIILMIISAPFIFIFSFLIWLEDKGPIFYSQTRTGLNGKEFKLTKLRTMKHLSETSGPIWASVNDNRITRIGSFLRRTRIDELPQLKSVLFGDMSLIGPRPERPEIEVTLKDNIPYYELRKVIKPGLSGWAQVNYPYGASIEDSEIKLSYELFYIRNQSFLLDILIFIKTIKLIINMKGSKPKR